MMKNHTIPVAILGSILINGVQTVPVAALCMNSVISNTC